MKAVILVGGLGTRLLPLTESVPKPMLYFNGKPILQHQIERLRAYGITNIIICTYHLSKIIEDYFKNGREFGVNITYSREEFPLGTSGALLNAKDVIGSNSFILLYGDLLIEIDFSKFIGFHIEKNGIGTLVLHQSSHPYDSDILEVDKSQKIVKFLGKPKKGQKFTNLANAGVYCFKPTIFKYLPQGKSMLDKEIIPKIISSGESLYAYLTDEKVMDLGTRDRYQSAKSNGE